MDKKYCQWPGCSEPTYSTALIRLCQKHCDELRAAVDTLAASLAAQTENDREKPKPQERN
jgi:hypothetical protein